jgi:hypothetical protein
LARERPAPAGKPKKTGNHMPKTAALNSLVNREPFTQLIGGLYSTIWLQDMLGGYTVSGRRKSDDAVVPLPRDAAQALVTDLDSLLGDAQTVDIQVGSVAYGVTKCAIVGGVEYIVSEHVRIPPSARGEPTVLI